ncbi:nucleoid-associated protein [Weissella bombi]|uniref:Nucleoid-associated protein n=1 Tax=Weissella bombi TaxID=1505725 RepID=A0A1C3YVD3_9LACO|nr:nucleoid-associated protein [Weissella bombi]SCB74057.1 hypothetical protein GA0061074_101157 [Weissella bombi]
MIIKHVILHVLDKNSGNLIASQDELDLNQPSLHEYIEKLIEKFKNSDYKTGQLTDNDAISTIISDTNEQSFAEKATTLAEELFEIIAPSDAIPAGDLLVVEFSEGAEDFFSILKLNFQPRYTHAVEYQDDRLVNNLVLNQAVLPAATQKVDEGIIINLMNGSYMLVEKRYLIDGHRTNYFSEKFLKIQPENSTKDNIQVIKQAVKSVASKFEMPEHEVLAETQNTIFDTVQDDGEIKTSAIAESVFKGNVSAQQAYQQIMDTKQLDDDIAVPNTERIEKKYRLQRFKLDSGIEISIPMDIYQDKSKVEFINKPDGTMSLVIKDIASIINKFNS